MGERSFPPDMSEVSGKSPSSVLTESGDSALGRREGGVAKSLQLLPGLGEAVLLDVPCPKRCTSEKCSSGHNLPRVAPKKPRLPFRPRMAHGRPRLGVGLHPVGALDRALGTSDGLGDLLQALSRAHCHG